MAERTYKLTMENGAEHIIRSEQSMLELANDLRSKAKISCAGMAGETLTIKSEDVRSIENYRSGTASR